MLDVANPLDAFELRVFDKVTRLKSLVQCDVHKFVDCRCDEKPTVIPVVRGEVRTATAQGDAQRTADDDHRNLLGRPDSMTDSWLGVHYRLVAPLGRTVARNSAL